ncbi:MAG: anaerobic ribonucleoside-triphosphate reductase [Promethearchaeota archaeon]
MVTTENSRMIKDLLPKVRTTRMDIESFDSGKIINSLMRETGINQEVAEKVTKTVLKRIIQSNVQWLSGPQIREMCCSVLAEMGFLEARKRYTRIGMPLMDYEALLTQGIKENANQYNNPESIHSWAADKIASEYVLLRLLKETQSKAHLQGDLHVHMLRYFDLRPFCQEFDLRMILKHGLPPCRWRHSAISTPAKHSLVAVLHAAKWLGIAQGEFAGGLGYDNFTVFMAPYLKGVTYEDAKQMAQCFLYESNQIYAARGAQVPFTSISCLPTIPESLRDVPAVSFGGKYDGVYGDYEEECNMFFRALSEMYYRGDGVGKLFNFPKHEIKLKREWLTKYEDEYLLISKEAAKFGTPYYLNMVANWMPDEVHSQCCRLILYKGEYQKICNDPDLFDWHKSFINIGSLQSVSLNLPRYAYQAAGDDDRLFEIIDRNMEIARDILFIKQQVIEKAMRNNLIPLCASKIDGTPLLDFRKQSLSIGYVGLNECVLAHTGYELHEDSQTFEFGKNIIRHLAKKCEEFTKNNLIKFALWQQPAESLGSNELVLIFNPNLNIYTLSEISKAQINGYSTTIGFDKDGHPKEMQVTKIIKHPKREIINIRYNHGEISVTNSHSLFTIDKNLNIICIEGKDIKIGTPLLIPRKINIPKNNDPLDLEGCCECIEENNIQYVKLNDTRALRFIDKTFKLGYILGHYIAEGTVKGVKIACGIDKQEIEKVANMVKEVFGLSTIINKHYKEGYQVVYNLMSPSQLAQNIFTKILELEPIFSMSKEIPPFLYNAPIECINGFLAGFIKGKKSINEDKKINSRQDICVSLSTFSQKLVFGLNFLLKQLGIITCISKQKFKNPDWHDSYELRITGKKNLEILSKFISDIPNGCGQDNITVINLNPWMKRLNAELKKYHGITLRSLYEKKLIQNISSVYTQQNWNRNISEVVLIKILDILEELKLMTPVSIKLDKLFRRNTLSIVLSIEKKKSIDNVYDLVVPENENFIAGIGQIYAHNSTSGRFAKLDLVHYPDKAIPLGNRNSNSVYYTNSDHLNYAANIPLFERIERQAEFHPIVKGGVITHIWMGEAYSDPEALWKFTKAIANTPTAYFTFTKDYTQCVKCLKFMSGIYYSCPHCGAPEEYIEWYSRITGYFSRVKRFNSSKFQEWQDRKRYSLKNYK